MPRPDPSPSRPSESTTIDRLWTAALVVLAVASVLVLAYPVARIGALPSLNYNEGWNAYRDQMAAGFRPLYAHPPTVWITNYPFLSFHVVGLLGDAIGDMVLAGRITALLSLLATAALVAVAVRRLAGSGRAGSVAGLCLLLWIATLTPERRAMDDPGLLAAAIGTFALVAVLEGTTDRRWLAVSGAAFATSLFVKQDVVALPLAVGIHFALTRRWRSLLVWASAGGAMAMGLFALTIEIDGPWFLAHLLRPRAYRPGHLATSLGIYLLHLGAPLALAGFVLIRNRAADERAFLALLLLTTNVVSVVLSGGDGVALNIFYPSLIALALCLSAAWPRRRGTGGDGVLRGGRTPILALLVPVLASVVLVPVALETDLGAWHRLPLAVGEARASIAVLKATHGPAICEDLLLCFRAGKPIGADPFFVEDQIAIGRLPDCGVLARLDPDREATIEIEGRVDDAAARRRFTASFMRSLFARDRIVSEAGPHTIFEPKDAGSPSVSKAPFHPGRS